MRVYLLTRLWDETSGNVSYHVREVSFSHGYTTLRNETVVGHQWGMCEPPVLFRNFVPDQDDPTPSLMEERNG